MPVATATRRAADIVVGGVLGERSARRARWTPRTRGGPSSSRWGEWAASRRAGAERLSVHAELAGPSVADDPDGLRRRSDPEGHPQEHRRAPARARRRCASSRASSPGDSTVTARRPASTAATSSSSRLPGPVNTTSGRVDAGPADELELATRGDVRPEPERAEVGDDRQGRVRLDRVGQVEARRQDAPAAAPRSARRRRGRRRRTASRGRPRAGRRRGRPACRPGRSPSRPRSSTACDALTGGRPRARSGRPCRRRGP